MTGAIEHWTSKLAREEFEKKIRKDEREKVLDELIDWAKDQNEWYGKIEFDALMQILNQCKQGERG